jgi:hypothetical protein
VVNWVRDDLVEHAAREVNNPRRISKPLVLVLIQPLVDGREVVADDGCGHDRSFERGALEKHISDQGCIEAACKEVPIRRYEHDVLRKFTPAIGRSDHAPQPILRRQEGSSDALNGAGENALGWSGAVSIGLL